MNTHTPEKIADLPTSESYQRHQRQRIWQIFVPVGLGALLILAIFALVIRTAIGTDAGGPVSQWADTSLIWLSLPALMFALVMALILIAMTYLLARLLKILPGYTYLVQHYVSLVSGYIRIGADKLVAPIIAVRSFGATVSALVGAVFGQRRK